mmetsp:Transcript_22112/g.39378  ORF Transcript_22112/g.39378 Transcript_22112/m.39378 type:complete len:377 (-) Transcript_22112:228-1358(-)
MVQLGLSIRLKSLVDDCLNKYLYTSAIFFADKLRSLFPQSPEAVFLLAKTYYASKQYRRAYLLLQNEEIIPLSPKYQHLAALCCIDLGLWDECLEILGEDDNLQVNVGDFESSSSPTPAAGFDDSGHAPGHDVSFRSALWFLRGRVFDALENRPKAIQCYISAIQCDPYCYDALYVVLQRHLLTSQEELELMSQLKFCPGDGWLDLIYRCKAKKYDQQNVLEDYLSLLDAPRISGSDTTCFPSEPLLPVLLRTIETMRQSTGSIPCGVDSDHHHHLYHYLLLLLYHPHHYRHQHSLPLSPPLPLSPSYFCRSSSPASKRASLASSSHQPYSPHIQQRLLQLWWAGTREATSPSLTARRASKWLAWRIAGDGAVRIP